MFVRPRVHTHPEITHHFPFSRVGTSSLTSTDIRKPMLIMRFTQLSFHRNVEKNPCKTKNNKRWMHALLPFTRSGRQFLFLFRRFRLFHELRTGGVFSSSRRRERERERDQRRYGVKGRTRRSRTEGCRSMIKMGTLVVSRLCRSISIALLFTERTSTIADAQNVSFRYKNFDKQRRGENCRGIGGDRHIGDRIETMDEAARSRVETELAGASERDGENRQLRDGVFGDVR